MAQKTSLPVVNGGALAAELHARLAVARAHVQARQAFESDVERACEALALIEHDRASNVGELRRAVPADAAATPSAVGAR